MNNIFLIFIYIILFSVNLFSFSNNKNNIQSDFYEKVIFTNIYKKRFSTYLKNNCPTEEDKCYQKYIKILNTWDSTKNDLHLKKHFIKYKSQTLITKKNWQNITNKLNTINIPLDQSQFISLVDLSRQIYILTLWNNKTKTFDLIGNDFISSGNIENEINVRKGDDHYLKTPTGTFKIKSGWRSSGKLLDDNTTMPYGKKDRYIFYFGKQKSIRYNSFDKFGNKLLNLSQYKLITDELEFAMHAHKSTKQIGHKSSHGCIRMSNELNLFIDNNFVLHKNNVINNKWQSRYNIKQPKIIRNTAIAGEYLIIFDKI